MDSQPYTISDPGVYPQSQPLSQGPPAHPPNVLRIVNSNDSGEPKHFRPKKYFLIILITLNILSYIVDIFFVGATVALVMQFIKLTGDHGDEVKGVQTLLTLVVIFFLVLAVLVETVFLFGIAHHNLCLTTVFVVVACLEAFGKVAKMMAAGGNGLLIAVLAILTAILAYLYLKDLRMMRDCQLQRIH